MPSLALPSSGDPSIDWAARNMPLLRDSIQRDGSAFRGLHIGIRLHIEPKTAVLCHWLLHAGARVTITGNLGTTDTTAAQTLHNLGVTLIGDARDGAVEDKENIECLLAEKPDLILDNGGDLIAALTLGVPRAAGFLGATEETTTGGLVIRALAPQPDFPVIVINDSRLKLLVENEYGVGQSVVQGFMNATNLMLPGARAAVIGYGPCGRGVADTLRGLGAHVQVVDTDPFRALEAVMRGHDVGPLDAVLSHTQLLFLATGARDIIGRHQIELLPDGAVIAGVSHEGLELDRAALSDAATAELDLSPAGGVAGSRVMYRLHDARTLTVLTRTQMLNLTAASGNPIQAMDLGLSLQARSLAAIARGEVRDAGPQCVPRQLDLDLAAALVHILTAAPASLTVARQDAQVPSESHSPS